MNVRQYTDTESSVIISSILAAAEDMFVHSHVGRPEAVSEYGVPYQSFTFIAQVTSETDPEVLTQTLISFAKHSLAKLCGTADDQVLVWRVRPEIETDADFDTGVQRVKIRFRAHSVNTVAFLTTLPPVVGLADVAGPKNDFAWALARIREGCWVRRASWDRTRYCNIQHIPTNTDDLLATDWVIR